MPDRTPKPSPLATVHAARSAHEHSPLEESGNVEDAGPDPIHLAVVQGLAANPASASMTGEHFATRVDELVASLGIPASLFGSGQRNAGFTADQVRTHARVLLGEIDRGEHALRDGKHDRATCDVCSATAWLETL